VQTINLRKCCSAQRIRLLQRPATKCRIDRRSCEYGVGPAAAVLNNVLEQLPKQSESLQQRSQAYARRVDILWPPNCGQIAKPRYGMLHGILETLATRSLSAVGSTTYHQGDEHQGTLHSHGQQFHGYSTDETRQLPDISKGQPSCVRCY
jgi:hypothetical protein